MKKKYFTEEARRAAINRNARKCRAKVRDEFQAALIAYPRRTWYYNLPLEERPE